MNDFSALPPLKSVIDAHGLLARKSLGQHFLLDRNITDRIVRYAGDIADANVIEIGPGPGGLTRSLLAAGARQLFVIEKDERFLAALEPLSALAGGRLSILHADALEADLTALVPAPRKIVANLPYNIGTALLIHWLELIYKALPLEGGQCSLIRDAVIPANAGIHIPETVVMDSRIRGNDGYENPSIQSEHCPPSRERTYHTPAFASMTLMFQKEVAERIIAAPGGKDYGRLSVLCQWLCETRYDFELPPGAFSPPPKVSSAVITLTPRPRPLVEVSKQALELVVAKAFGQRRKMLRSALKGLAVDAETLLQAAEIDGTLRAEQLDVMTLCRLAQAYQRLV